MLSPRTNSAKADIYYFKMIKKDKNEKEVSMVVSKTGLCSLISNMEYVTTKTCIEYRSPNLCQKHEHNICQRIYILKKHRLKVYH